MKKLLKWTETGKNCTIFVFFKCMFKIENISPNNYD